MDDKKKRLAWAAHVPGCTACHDAAVQQMLKHHSFTPETHVVIASAKPISLEVINQYEGVTFVACPAHQNIDSDRDFGGKNTAFIVEPAPMTDEF